MNKNLIFLIIMFFSFLLSASLIDIYKKDALCKKQDLTPQYKKDKKD